jgi:alkyl hydroperoxide reductase subunit AhpF
VAKRLPGGILQMRINHIEPPTCGSEQLFPRRKVPAWQRLSSAVASMQQSYEVLIIGSGYGGSIAASRLARAGASSTCVT